VRGLLAFARDTQEEKQPAAVAQILSDALALTRSQMHKEGIALSTDLPPDLPDIVANPQQIQQVFMNVISNARYALNQKYTTPDADKALEIRAERLSAGGRLKVRIVFIDRGAGIAPDLMNKILEPFFTTKPDSKGTGLGLSISHGIVSDHGGRFVIESQEGEFTKVIIDLPAKEGSNGTDSDHR
jgi:signal transduction histidine kinase